jgi:hypothetical protein
MISAPLIKPSAYGGDSLMDDFLEKIEVWDGPASNGDRRVFPKVLKFLTGIRIQDGFVVIEAINEDGESEVVAISLDHLVEEHREFIEYSHPEDAERAKNGMLSALRRAIDKIENQHSKG